MLCVHTLFFSEFLLGADLLVKPVVQPGQTSVDVYFPGILCHSLSLSPQAGVSTHTHTHTQTAHTYSYALLSGTEPWYQVYGGTTKYNSPSTVRIGKVTVRESVSMIECV